MTIRNVFTRRRVGVLPLLALVVGLTGCGGGSSDSTPGGGSDPADGGNGNNGDINDSVVEVLDSFGIDNQYTAS